MRPLWPKPGGGRGRRPPPCRAIDRRHRPDRQWLFPRQTRPGEAYRGLGRPLHNFRATQFMEFLGGIADSSADGSRRGAQRQQQGAGQVRRGAAEG